MNAATQQALRQDRVIDITTTGRKSGEPRRIEIWFHNVDDRLFITGLPGKRSWYANLLATPAFTFHLKESVSADIPARAVPILDESERRRILGPITNNLDRVADLDQWLESSPLVEVLLE